MTTATHHIIKKQTLEVCLPSRHNHRAVSEQVSGLFYREVLPQLSRLFDRLAPPGITFSIGRLSIDLGVLPPGALDRDLSKRFLETAEKALRELLPEAFALGNEPAPKIATRSREQTLEAAFTAFLETGTMPWWHTIDHFETFEQALLSLPPERLVPLIRQAAAVPRARRRLAMQFSERFFRRLLTLDSRNSGRPAVVLPSISIAKKEALLIAAFQDEKELPEKTNPNEMVAGPTRDREILPETAPEPHKPDLNRTNSQSKPPGSSAGSEYYLHNAGLILLWPFLEPFFDALGLLQDGDFKDENARQRAVHLTEYLVSGRSNAKEYELTLNKLLCGHPLEEPLISHVRLRKTEKRESEQLLLEVIGHWAALGDIDPAALQESFLQRDGKLLRQGGNWRLQVEQKAYDMLLGSLPWGVGMVKLGWGEGVVYVEWS